MGESLLDCELNHVAPVEAAGVTFRLADAARRYSVRFREENLAVQTIGGPLPAHIGETLDGVARLGPDELFVVWPANRAMTIPASQAICIVDISERSVGIIVDGARAIDVVSAGCPLDLTRMPVGRTVRTIFETVEIVVYRVAVDRFRLEVWRSFAPWLWETLCTAVRDGDVPVVNIINQ